MEYLKIFTDFARSMEPLDDAERGRLFSAMLAYAERGQIPDLPGNERFIWPTAQLHIDREIEFCEKQRQRGIHGGRPKTRKNPEKPEETQKEKDKDNDKDKDNPSSPDGEDVSRPRGPYANVYLTDRELETFRAEYPDAESRIQRMGEYLASTGKTYKNYLATLRHWARQDEADKPPDPRQTEQKRRDAWLRQYIKT